MVTDFRYEVKKGGARERLVSKQNIDTRAES